MKLLSLPTLTLTALALGTIAASPVQARDEWENLGTTREGVVTLNLTRTQPTESNSRVFFAVYGLLDIRFNSNGQPQVAGVTVFNSGINCRTRQAQLLGSSDDRGHREYNSDWFTPGQQTPEALVLSRVCR